MKTLIFTGKNCKACKIVKHELATAGIPYIELDVESHEYVEAAGGSGVDLQQRWKILNLPTVVKVVKGQPANRWVGSMGVNIWRRELK